MVELIVLKTACRLQKAARGNKILDRLEDAFMGATAIQRTPLIDGAHMNAVEFIERWNEMPDVKFAELIDGVVHMASPVGPEHRNLQQVIDGWILQYRRRTPGVTGGGNGSWRMTVDETDHVLQPDVTLEIQPEFGGQSKKKSLMAGAPELAIEISVTSKRYDKGPKLDIYRAAGVKEYLVLNPTARSVCWLRLNPDDDQPIAADANGIHRSITFPGLWLNARALFDDDINALLGTLDDGLATAEHKAFVASLEAKQRALKMK